MSAKYLITFFLGLCLWLDGWNRVGSAANEVEIIRKASGPTMIKIAPGVHMVYGQYLHTPAEDCPDAKIDLWADSGRIEYVISASGQWPEKADLAQHKDGAQIRLGRGNCVTHLDIASE